MSSSAQYASNQHIAICPHCIRPSCPLCSLKLTISHRIAKPFLNSIKLLPPYSPTLKHIREASLVSLLVLRDSKAPCVPFARADMTVTACCAGSVSFGGTRRFLLRQNSDHSEKWACELASGDVLIMKGSTQLHWTHSIPKMLRVSQPRINLTFRQIVHPET